MNASIFKVENSLDDVRQNWEVEITAFSCSLAHNASAYHLWQGSPILLSSEGC